MSNEDPIKRFVEVVLAQAQKDGATAVAIAPVEGETMPVRYEVGGQWYDMAPPPARLRTGVLAELGRLANLPEGPFPKEGVIEMVAGDAPAKWELTAPAAEGEWMLTRTVQKGDG